MIDRIAIFDLDETLCDTSKRIKHRLKLDHKAYNKRCKTDVVYQDAKGLFTDISNSANTAIFINTARPFFFRDATHDWLFHNGIFIPIKRLFMREDDDDRSDSAVKLDNLKVIRKLFKEGTPVIAFDDRSKVIRMYRSQGVTALQIRKGEY